MTRGLARVPASVRRDIIRRGRVLLAARQSAGLTQRQVARLAGIGQATVAGMEVGRLDPLLDRYLRAGLALAEPPDERRRTLDVPTIAAQEVARWRQVIRAARENARLSQQEVADAIGSAQAAVSRVELGGPVPRLSTMLRLAEVVGADV